MYAANSANEEAVGLLLNRGADPNFHKGRDILKGG